MKNQQFQPEFIYEKEEVNSTVITSMWVHSPGKDDPSDTTGSCSGEVTYLFEIAQLTEMRERKEKYACVPQSLRFFGQ